MANRNNNLIKLALVALVVLFAAGPVRADAAGDYEYQIKAAFVYNFIKFVDWPDEAVGEPNDTLVIGIIGQGSFGNSFEPLMYKLVKNRRLVVRQFGGLSDFINTSKGTKDETGKSNEYLKTIKGCRVLFICSSEKKDFARIIELLKGSAILTISETDGFLESGGMINFLMDGEKVCFEINADAAELAGLKIRAKLLSLAKRVISEETSQNVKD